MSEPASKKARTTDDGGSAQASPGGKKASGAVASSGGERARHLVMPVRLFQKFLDALFLPENDWCLGQWMKDPSGWTDDSKLREYEDAHAAGRTAEFWQQWRSEQPTAERSTSAGLSSSSQ